MMNIPDPKFHDKSVVAEAQSRVIRHLPADGSYATMPFSARLPMCTAWMDGRLIFERHPTRNDLFRLTNLGKWLKTVEHDD